MMFDYDATFMVASWHSMWQ